MNRQMVSVGSEAPINDTRARQILTAARDLFLRDGWDGFSIEAVADAAECSRPLIYKHFASKEDVLIALALQSRWRRAQLCSLALQFKGLSRERMVAYGVTDILLTPRDLPIEQFVTSANLRSKVSEDRVTKLKELGVQVAKPAIQIIEEAIAEGDVELPAGITPASLWFVFWASRWGASSIVRSDTPLKEYGVVQPDIAMDLALNSMMDGLGWKPLFAEWDYFATMQRTRDEVFPDAVVSGILNR